MDSDSSSRLSVDGKGKRVAVGLSGGVDSAVTAALLKEQGYDVTGVFLECWRAPGCRVDEDRKDALDVALQLGIPYKVLDFKKAYKDRVVEYFYQEYQSGRTPNPDTMCNREIKFGLFYDWAIKENGFDYVATGHYARVASLLHSAKSRVQSGQNKDLYALRPMPYALQRGADPKKDQSYFLYLLKPEQLPHVLFPIGGMTKNMVRAKAKELNLKVADKPDSQGICFIGPVNIRSFLKERIKEKTGDIVLKLSTESLAKFKNKNVKFKTTLQKAKFKTKDSIVVGKHVGVPFYTVGQKVGPELDRKWLARLSQEDLVSFDSTEMPHLFVVDKDVETNTLTIGLENELDRNEFQVSDLNWLINPLDSQSNNQLTNQPINLDCFVRIRNLGDLVSAQLTIKDNKVLVKTAKPLRAVAQGQACVFYVPRQSEVEEGSDNTIDAVVLGGGVIV